MGEEIMQRGGYKDHMEGCRSVLDTKTVLLRGCQINCKLTVNVITFGNTSKGVSHGQVLLCCPVAAKQCLLLRYVLCSGAL